jgi:hypothetical protein
MLSVTAETAEYLPGGHRFINIYSDGALLGEGHTAFDVSDVEEVRQLAQWLLKAADWLEKKDGTNLD